MPDAVIVLSAFMIVSPEGVAKTGFISSDSAKAEMDAHSELVDRSHSVKSKTWLPRSTYIPVRGSVSVPTRVASVTPAAPSVPPESVTGCERVGVTVAAPAVAIT